MRSIAGFDVRLLVLVDGDLREHQLRAGVVRVQLQRRAARTPSPAAGSRRRAPWPCRAAPGRIRDRPSALPGTTWRASALLYFSRNSSPHSVLMRGSVGASADRVAEKRLRIVDAIERARRARGAQVVARARIRAVGHQDQLQRAAAFGPLADVQLQQAELERGVAAGVGGRERLQDRFGPARNRRAPRRRARDTPRSFRPWERPARASRLRRSGPARKDLSAVARAVRHVLGLLGRDARREPGREHHREQRGG